MSAFATSGKIAGVLAFPVVFGGCCGGGGLLVLGSNAMAALGPVWGGVGLVAAPILAMTGLRLARKRSCLRRECETEIETDI